MVLGKIEPFYKIEDALDILELFESGVKLYKEAMYLAEKEGLYNSSIYTVLNMGHDYIRYWKDRILQDPKEKVEVENGFYIEVDKELVEVEYLEFLKEFPINIALLRKEFDLSIGFDKDTTIESGFFKETDLRVSSRTSSEIKTGLKADLEIAFNYKAEYMVDVDMMLNWLYEAYNNSLTDRDIGMRVCMLIWTLLALRYMFMNQHSIVNYDDVFDIQKLEEYFQKDGK